MPTRLMHVVIPESPNVDAKDTEIPRMISLSKFTTDDHRKELASALLFGEVWTNLANTLPSSSS